MFGSVCLRTVLYICRPLSGVYKDVSPIQEKSNIIYKFSCHCGSDYVGKTSQRFHLRINQHVPKVIRNLINDTSAQPKENCFSELANTYWTTKCESRISRKKISMWLQALRTLSQFWRLYIYNR